MQIGSARGKRGGKGEKKLMNLHIFMMNVTARRRHHEDQRQKSI